MVNPYLAPNAILLLSVEELVRIEVLGLTIVVTATCLARVLSGEAAVFIDQHLVEGVLTSIERLLFRDELLDFFHDVTMELQVSFEDMFSHFSLPYGMCR